MLRQQDRFPQVTVSRLRILPITLQGYAEKTGEGFRRAAISSQHSSVSRRSLKGSWFNSFIPMSLDSLKSVFTTHKDPTVTASSSLTGLPWIMTFEQQFEGGLPVVSMECPVLR